MQVFGLMMVRNEADILRTNLLHHFALGIDHFLIVDNGSEDGTDRVVEELSGGGRVAWTRDPGPYRQSEIITELALEAYLRGADWVVPIDADEFWHAPRGDFRSVLESSAAGALRVEVVNYIQQRDQYQATPDALLSMTRRAPQPAGPLERVRDLVNNKEYAFVEVVYAPKWISRASLSLHIGVGNHEVMGVTGPLEETNRILCLHAPLRSRFVFTAQVGHAQRAVEAGNLKVWHWLRWQQLAQRGELDAEWRANSYEDACLDVHGVPHPVVEDFRLRDLVAPWIGRALKTESVAHSPPLQPGVSLAECVPDLVRTTLARMNRIEGWLTETEAALLMATVALAVIEREPNEVVETGSYCGRSTVVLGGVLKAVCPGAKLHAIDPHEGEVARDGPAEPPTLERFLRNVEEAGLADVVQVIRKRSFEVAWSKPISLLFIDGLHDYESVSRDFAHFQALIVPCGYAAFHDYDRAYPGVVAFVDELLASGKYREFQRAGSLIVLEKAMSKDDEDTPDMVLRLERQRKGIAVLRDLLREAVSRREEELAGRDKRIVELQEELFAKVAERDHIIRELQAELHQKVGECNRIIRELQAELHGKVKERDRMIRDLQAQLEQARRDQL